MELTLYLFLFLSIIGTCYSQTVTLRENMHLLGGTRQQGLVSVEACLNACAANSACLAMDFNRNSVSCWFHFADTVCRAPVNKASCLHYTFTPCPVPTNPQGVTRLTGMHVAGGVLEGFGLTVDECLLRCGRSASCTGFDFDTNGNSCWLHSQDTECTPTISKSTCTHYRFLDCSVDNTQGTTARPDIAPPITQFETFQGMHIRFGTKRLTMTSAAQCLQLCWSEPDCLGFDFNAISLGCYTHSQITECNELISKPFCSHYRVRANCQADTLASCTTPVFTQTPFSKRVDGVRIAQGVILSQCEDLCAALPDCVAVDFKADGGECFMFNYTGIPTSDLCCTHSIKTCPVIPTTMAMTQIVETTTEIPIFVPNDTIPDGGKCSDDFSRIDNGLQAGGTVNTTVTNENDCKKLCLDMDTACAAATFNKDAMTCTTHATLDLTNFSGNTCCIHFRRITCEPRQCYVHDEEDVTATLFSSGFDFAATFARLDVYTPLFNPPTEECAGQCVTTVRFQPASDGSGFPNIVDTSVPLVVERGCKTTHGQTTTNAQKTCDLTVLDAGTDYQEMSCTCNGDRCNAFGLLLNDCVAHYPLDCSADDLSFGRRNGLDIELEYDAFTMQKNWSALFTGQSRIKIPQFTNFFWGRIDGAGLRRPGFTVTMWIYRLEQQSTHYILSNGESYNIYSEPDGTGSMHFIKWKIRMAGVEYELTSTAQPYDTWLWLAFVINDNTVNYSFDLYVDATDNPNVSLDTGIAFDANTAGPTVDTQILPLCIGDRSVSRNQIFETEPTGEPFVGYIDEIWMFSRSVGALNSVKEHSSSDGLFNA